MSQVSSDTLCLGPFMFVHGRAWSVSTLTVEVVVPVAARSNLVDVLSIYYFSQVCIGNASVQRLLLLGTSVWRKEESYKRSGSRLYWLEMRLDRLLQS